jgi:hypothetical protein
LVEKFDFLDFVAIGFGIGKGSDIDGIERERSYFSHKVPIEDKEPSLAVSPLHSMSGCWRVKRDE